MIKNDLDAFSTEFILEHMSASCVIHDSTGDIRYVNPAARAFFGISSIDLLNSKKHLNDWDLLDSNGRNLDPEDFPIIFVLKNKTAYSPKLIGFQSPDHLVKWCLVKAIPKFDSDGEVVSVFVSFTDETKSFTLLNKLTEEKEILQRSEKLLDAGSWTFDVARKEIKCSENLFQIFGINSSQSLLYEDYLELLNDSERKQIVSNIEKVIQQAEPYEVVQIIRGKTIQSIGIPIKNFEGQVVRVHSVFRDITVETEKNHKLAELAVVVETTENIVLITDPKGRITWANQGYTDLTEYSLAESIGKKPGHLLQGVDTDRKTRKKVSEALREKRSITTEILNYSKSGRPYWLYMNIQPIFDKSGKCLSMVAIELDLTERRENEEKLKNLTDKLQNVIADRDKLYSILTHDLRSPFAGLIGFSDLILEYHAQMPKEEIVSTVRRLNQISNQTLSMIDDFLRWITNSSVERKLEKEVVNLKEIVLDIRGFYTDIAALKGISIELEINDDPKAKTHKASVQTILRNIIGNSIKFCSKGDEIRLNLNSTKDDVLITVGDSGRGMTKESVLDFKKQRKANSQIGSSGEKGYGLGLALVLDLCKEINIEIDVESEVGKGTMFLIKIPFID